MPWPARSWVNSVPVALIVGDDDVLTHLPLDGTARLSGLGTLANLRELMKMHTG